MKTIIVYFSATGNSLTTATKVSCYYDHCSIIDIRESQAADIDCDILGIVCPVYYGTTAYRMIEYIKNMNFKTQPYIFLMTTCKGHTGSIANRVAMLLKKKGQKLSISRNIIMPGNSWISTIEENKERLSMQDENIKKAMGDILAKKVEIIDEIELKETPVDYPNNFRGITVDENCIGCGVCEKVCPMNNIKIVNKKSIIGNNCMTCLCCFHWCPIEAIYMSKEENVGRRFKYHHPEVKVQNFYIKSIDE